MIGSVIFSLGSVLLYSLSMQSVDNVNIGALRPVESNVCFKLVKLSGTFVEGLYKDCLRFSKDYHPVAVFLDKLLWYVSWHKEVSGRSTVDYRTLSWKCLKPHCGGYGDQTRGMAHALLLAVMSERALSIKTVSVFKGEVYNPGPVVLVPKTIDWKVLLDKEPFDPKQKVFVDHGPAFPAEGVCNAVFSTDRTDQHVVYTTQHWHMSCLLNASLATHNHALRDFSRLPSHNNDVFEFLATILAYFLFQYSEGVLRQERQFKKSWGISKSPYIGVHIRTGMFPDGMDEHINRGQTKTEMWDSQVQCALRKAKSVGVKAPVVVVSDSKECKEWLKSKYPGIVHVTSVSPLHCSKNRPNPSAAGWDADKEEIYFNEIVSNMAEMALLSHADVLIQESSGFSRAAKWIGGIPSTHTFCCFSKCTNYNVVYKS